MNIYLNIFGLCYKLGVENACNNLPTYTIKDDQFFKKNVISDILCIILRTRDLKSNVQKAVAVTVFKIFF